MSNKLDRFELSILFVLVSCKRLRERGLLAGESTIGEPTKKGEATLRKARDAGFEPTEKEIETAVQLVRHAPYMDLSS